jgi:hypothetical protein
MHANTSHRHPASPAATGLRLDVLEWQLAALAGRLQLAEEQNVALQQQLKALEADQPVRQLLEELCRLQGLTGARPPAAKARRQPAFAVLPGGSQ